MTLFKFLRKLILDKSAFITKNLFNDHLLVLCFHEISDHASKFQLKYDLNLSIKSFEKLMKVLSKEYNFVNPKSLSELKASKIKGKNVLLTFDDGFEGSFSNTHKILEYYNAPAVYFLNMNSIINNVPLISSIASYDEQYLNNNSRKNYHLFLNINEFKMNKKRYKKVEDDILLYQGKLVSYSQLIKFSEYKNIYYANHMYDHFNVKALNNNEIKEMYNNNINELNKFPNYINYFSFPNGNPNNAFTKSQLNYITNIFNPSKIFSCSRRFNFKNYKTLDRIAVSDNYSNLKDFEYLKIKTLLNFL